MEIICCSVEDRFDKTLYWNSLVHSPNCTGEFVLESIRKNKPEQAGSKNLGNPIESISIVITHCPFCGKSKDEVLWKYIK